MIQVFPKEVKKLLALRESTPRESAIQIVPEGKVSKAIDAMDEEEKRLKEEANSNEINTNTNTIQTPNNDNNKNVIEDYGDESTYNKVYINGSIAYVCQSAFIQNNTLKK